MIIEYLPDIEFSRCIGKIYMRSLSFLDKSPIDKITFFVIRFYYKEGDFMVKEETFQVHIDADSKKQRHYIET